MRNLAVFGGGNVIVFRRPIAFHCLTQQDKQDVRAFRGRAEAAGYDALIVHQMSPTDEIEVLDYVSAHRAGEAWSTWGFARVADLINAWNALNCSDVGSFPSMEAALRGVLLRDDASFKVVRAGQR
jgi:hypothetical protein